MLTIMSTTVFLFVQVGSHPVDFKAYVQEHSRDYEPVSPEYVKREVIFRKRGLAVQRQNDRDDGLWKAALNKFADRSDAEFAAVLGWRHHFGQHSKPSPTGSSLLEFGDVPDKIDWRNLSMAKHIKDQGSCGSCWAVAAATVLEAHYEITHKRHRTFSAQELVSCVQNPMKCGGSGACQGATVELAMDWATYRGLDTEENVQYLGKTGNCLKEPFRQNLRDAGEVDPDGRVIALPKMQPESFVAEKSGSAFGMTGFTTLPTNQYAPLMNAIVSQGPVAVSVGADSWMLYSSGIFDSCEKDVTLNHAVTLFGYGHVQASGKDYWLIRNSWGPTWGEAGFIRVLKREAEEEHCGLDSDPKMGVSCDVQETPASVRVCGTCGILYDSVVPSMQAASSGLEASGRVRAIDARRMALAETASTKVTASIAADGGVASEREFHTEQADAMLGPMHGLASEPVQAAENSTTNVSASITEADEVASAQEVESAQQSLMMRKIARRA